MFLVPIAFILILANAFNAEDPTEPTTTLVQVQTMFRHGVRSILIDYPNDTKKAYWDKYGGYGQLTSVGMKELYDYGLFFKNRYSSFLNPVYKKSQVYARSTDYDRTMQSVQSFLAALYKPNSDQEWNSEPGLANYMPIPVHTNNLTTDNILHANAPCPRYDELRVQMRSTSSYLAFQEENKEFLELMIQQSGLTNLKDNVYMIWQIADKAMVEEAHELELEQYIIDNYDKIMELNDHTFYIDFVTVEMGKLISGGLLNDIINNMKKKVAGGTNQLFIYGVHDNYVAGMQKLLNTSTEFVQPNFASGFVFELRKDEDNDYYVKVFYKNNKYPDPDVLEPVTVYGCETLCPLETFFQLMENKVIVDFKKPCASKPPVTTKKTTTKKKTTVKKKTTKKSF